jgi:hypothetical protein
MDKKGKIIMGLPSKVPRGETPLRDVSNSILTLSVSVSVSTIFGPAEDSSRDHEDGLYVQGAKLFNLLPRHIHDMNTGTTDQFKAELDSWLGKVPDQPTIPGR